MAPKNAVFDVTQWHGNGTDTRSLVIADHCGDDARNDKHNELGPTLLRRGVPGDLAARQYFNPVVRTPGLLRLVYHSLELRRNSD